MEFGGISRNFDEFCIINVTNDSSRAPEATVLVARATTSTAPTSQTAHVYRHRSGAATSGAM